MRNYIILFLIFFYTVIFSQDNMSNQDVVAESNKQMRSRGFEVDLNLPVNGNFAVSDMSLTPSYSYPVSVFSKRGHKFNVNVNYAHMVNTTSFSHYRHPSGDTIGRWQKLNVTKPMWIVGFNGFAVQVLSYSNSPVLHKNFIEDSTSGQFDNDGSSDVREFNGDKFTWLIEGYEYCNTMGGLVSHSWINDFKIFDNYNFGSQEAISDVSANRDINDRIKILKSDGSVLTFKNVTRVGDLSGPYSKDYEISDTLMHTGVYFIEDPNFKGHAIVEFLEEEEIKENFLELEFPRAYPRKMTFFPGDGTSYVFIEKKGPYGELFYDNILPRDIDFIDEGILNRSYGNWHAGPSIFYLVEVKDQYGTLVNLEYDFNHKFSGVGRAPLKSLDHHKFEMDNIYYGISAFDQYHNFTLKTQINPTDNKNFNLHDYANSQSDDFNWYTRTAYVDKIERAKDGNNNSKQSIFIKYDTLYHSYHDYDFPTFDVSKNCNIDSISIFRLRSIREGNKAYFLDYAEDSIYSPTDSITIIEPSRLLVMGLDHELIPRVRELRVSEYKGIVSGSESYETLRKIRYGWEYHSSNLLYNFSKETSKIDIDMSSGDSIITNYYWKRERDKQYAVSYDAEYHQRNSYTYLGRKMVSPSLDTTNNIKLIDYEIHAKHDTTKGGKNFFPVEKISFIEFPTGGTTRILKTNKTKFGYDLGIVNHMYQYLDDYSLYYKDKIPVNYIKSDTIFNYDPLADTIINYQISNHKYLEQSGLPYEIVLPGSKYSHSEAVDEYYRRIENGELDPDDWYGPVHWFKNSDEELYHSDTLPENSFILPRYVKNIETSFYNANDEIISRNIKNIELDSINGQDLEYNRGNIISDTTYGQNNTLKSINSYSYLLPNLVGGNFLNGHISSNYGQLTKVQNNINGSDSLAYDLEELYATKLFNTDNSDSLLLSNGYYFNENPGPRVITKVVRKINNSNNLIESNLRQLFNRNIFGTPIEYTDENLNYYSKLTDYKNRHIASFLPGDLGDTSHNYNKTIKQDLVFKSGSRLEETIYSTIYSERLFTYIESNASDYTEPEELYFETGTDDSVEIKKYYNLPINNLKFIVNDTVILPKSNCQKLVEDDTLASDKYYNGIPWYPQIRHIKAEENLTSKNYDKDQLDTRYYKSKTTSDFDGHSKKRTQKQEIPREGYFCMDFEQVGATQYKCILCEEESTHKEGIESNEFIFSPGVSEDYGVLTQIDSAFVKFYIAKADSGTVMQIKMNFSDTTFTILNTFLNDIGDNANDNDSITPFEINLSNFETTLYSNVDVISKLLSEFPTFVITTTTLGSEISILGGNRSDFSPQIYISGDFEIPKNTLDATLFNSYEDQYQERVTTSTKIDDEYHSHNDQVATWADKFTRHTTVTDHFNHDKKVGTSIISSESDTTVSITTNKYNGRNNLTSSTNAVGDSVLTEYDALGRIIKTTDQVGRETTYEYSYGDESDFGITEYYRGFVKEVTLNKPDGLVTKSYYDNTDQLRKEIINYKPGSLDTNEFNKTTKWEFDDLGKLTMVINPAGDTISYEYDDFQRVKYKNHPDFGTESYAYDNLDNVRFKQTEKQSEEGNITFYEYDDLNRVTVIGEATIDFTGLNPVSFYRLTDIIDPNYIHNDNKKPTGVTDNILTVNVTKWNIIHADFTVPKIKPYDIDSVEFAPYLQSLMKGYTGENNLIDGSDMLFHEVEDQTYSLQAISDTSDFEDFTLHGDNIRIAYHYDEMPIRQGYIWKNLSPDSVWAKASAPVWRNDSLIRDLRNQKGKVSAIAYRQLPTQNFNYIVFSYDERGRVEAMIRYTENIGFDAVYYEYNHMNKPMQVTVVDPLNTNTTWYDYDGFGRMNQYWNKLEPFGLCRRDDGYYNLPESPEIVLDSITKLTPIASFEYDKLFRTTQKFLHEPSLVANYDYNSLGMLDSLYYFSFFMSDNVFKEKLIYEVNNNLIDSITYEYKDSTIIQELSYDSLYQVKTSYQSSGFNVLANESFEYDLIGNRKIYSHFKNGIFNFNNYHFEDSDGPDRLSKIVYLDFVDTIGVTNLEYFPDGALKMDMKLDFTRPGFTEYSISNYDYDFRGLTDRFYNNSGGFYSSNRYCFDPTSLTTPNTEWNYFYNPFDEREQRRLVNGKQNDTLGIYPWIYYGLDGSNKQHFIWNGMQNAADSLLNSKQEYMRYFNGKYVFFYPTEYNTFSDQLDYKYKFDTLTGNWIKNYYVYDHLGSVRSVIIDHDVLSNHIYKAYGEQLDVSESRLGYIGQEKDKESLLGDHGVRKFSYFTGRFNSIDPLWEKYIEWSPYQYSLNNPFLFKDFDGEDVIVAFSGANFSGDQDKAIAGKLEDDFNGLNIEDLDIKAFATSAYPKYFHTQSAINFIKENLDPNEKLIIYGYSSGGYAASRLVEKLDEIEIEVDLLITVDRAFSIPGLFLGEYNVPGNVKENLNYFQESYSKILSRGSISKALKPQNTSILNFLVGNTSHSLIDEVTYPFVFSDIFTTINNGN